MASHRKGKVTASPEVFKLWNSDQGRIPTALGFKKIYICIWSHVSSGKKLRELLYQNDFAMEAVNLAVERQSVQEHSVFICPFPCMHIYIPKNSGELWRCPWWLENWVTACIDPWLGWAQSLVDMLLRYLLLLVQHLLFEDHGGECKTMGWKPRVAQKQSSSWKTRVSDSYRLDLFAQKHGSHGHHGICQLRLGGRTFHGIFQLLIPSSHTSGWAWIAGRWRRWSYSWRSHVETLLHMVPNMI